MRAAIYARISFDPDGGEQGVQRQEDLCRQLAERLGMTVVAVFVDNDVSASSRSSKPRPHYAEMLERARQGEFAAIVAYSNSRLTRRPQEYNELIDIAVKYKVRICTVASGEFDMGTADGRAVARTIAAWDAAESDRLSERIKAAASQRRVAGRFHGGPAPWGYRLEKKNLIVVPDEADLIRSAVERIIRGDTLRSVARDWNRAGGRTPRGALWNGEGLREKIARPAVQGRNTAGVLAWEPIVDEATYAKLLAVLATHPNTGESHEATSMGSGLTHCGLCGYHLVATEKHGRRVLSCLGGQPLRADDGPDARPSPNGLSCGHVRIENDRLERYVFEQVMSNVAGGTIKPRLRSAENFAVVERIDAELLELRAQKYRLEELQIRGDIDASEYRVHARRLRKEIESATGRVNTALGAAQFAESLVGGLDWSKWTPIRRAHFLKALIMRVHVLPFQDGRKHAPVQPRKMPDDAWVQWRETYWETTLPQRVRITYWDPVDAPDIEEERPTPPRPNYPRLHALPTVTEPDASSGTLVEHEPGGVEGQEAWVGGEEVAEHLSGMSHLTVLKWAKEGRIPGIKPGQRWLFRISEVDAELMKPKQPQGPSSAGGPRLAAMDWALEGLKAAGFAGFVPFSDLEAADVPTVAGVYVIVRLRSGVPEFLSQSAAGRFKGKDPTVPVEKLTAKWLPATGVLYIGKADLDATGKRGLRTRLDEYRRNGAGEPIGHWGGRYIWQLADSKQLLVGWKETPPAQAEIVESEMIADFIAQHGVLPFANLKRGRSPRAV